MKIYRYLTFILTLSYLSVLSMGTLSAVSCPSVACMNQYAEIMEGWVKGGLYEYSHPDTKVKGWAQISEQYVDYQAPVQGWKVHVGYALDEDLIPVWEAVLKYLRDNKIRHKTFGSYLGLYLLESNPSEETKSQIAKLVTIYPKNEQHAVQLIKDLDDHIEKTSPNASFKTPPYEAIVGNSGAITVRYGKLSGEDDFLTPLDKDGNPIKNYKDEKILDSKDGTGDRWEKYIYKPDFVTWNPFEGLSLKPPAK